jgi:hypothetical protein
MPSNVVNLLGGLPSGQMRVTVPPSEVVARLQAKLDPDPPLGRRWGYWLTRKYRFYGQVNSVSFRIHKWWNGRRLDDPALVGTIKPDGAGTLLSFEVQPAKWSLIFLAAFPVVWGGVWLLGFQAGVLPFFAEWGMWGKLGIAVFVLPVVILFWWLFRNEGKALLGFLEERLGDVKVAS